MASEQVSKDPGSSAVDWSLGSAFRDSQVSFGELEGDGQRIGKVLALTTREAVRLGIEFKSSQERAAQSAREWLTALNNIYNNLTNQLAALPKLTGLYQQLGQAMQSAKLPAAQMAAPDHGATVIGAANSVLGMVAKPMADAASYQSIINDLVVKSGASPGAVKATDPGDERANGIARTEQRDKITERINSTVAEVSRQTGMGDAAAADLIRQMVDAGISLDRALELAPTAAQFSVGQEVDAKDTAAMFRSLVDGKVANQDMPGVLNRIIGDARADGAKVGIGDVAQMMPRLMAAMIAQNEFGADAVGRVSQMVQTRGQRLGSSIQISSDVEQSIEKRDLPAPAPQRNGDNYLEGDVAVRRDGSEQRQKEMEAAFTRLSASIGDAMRPVTDTVVDLLGGLANGLASVVDAGRPVVTVLGTVALAGAAFVSAFGVVRAGNALVSAGQGLFAREQGDGARNDWRSRVARAGSRLVNEPDPASSTGALRGQGVQPVRVFVTNIGDLGGSGSGGGGGGGGGKTARRDKKKAMESNLARNRGGNPRRSSWFANLAEAGGSWGGEMLGRFTDSLSNSAKMAKTRRGAAYITAGILAGYGVSSAAAAEDKAEENGAAGGIPAGSGLANAAAAEDKAEENGAAGGIQESSGLANAATPEDKAEEYGAAAGSMGGSALGGVVGGIIGQALIPIPGVGMAIGSMVGSTLGGGWGADLGGRLGKFLFGSDEKPSEKSSRTADSATAGSPVSQPPQPGASVATVTLAPVVEGSLNKPVVVAGDPMTGGYTKAVPPPITVAAASNALEPSSGQVLPVSAGVAAAQNFTISPSIPITVQGTIADPAGLVSQLAPQIQKLFNDLAAQANRGTEYWDMPATARIA